MLNSEPKVIVYKAQPLSFPVRQISKKITFKKYSFKHSISKLMVSTVQRVEKPQNAMLLGVGRQEPVQGTFAYHSFPRDRRYHGA